MLLFYDLFTTNKVSSRPAAGLKNLTGLRYHNAGSNYIVVTATRLIVLWRLGPVAYFYDYQKIR